MTRIAREPTKAEYQARRRAYERRQRADERAMKKRADLATLAQRQLSALLKIPDGKRTAQHNKRIDVLQREYIEHQSALFTLAVKDTIAGVPIGLADRALISTAASSIIGIADNYGICLTDIIAEIERYIVQETKVTDAGGTPRTIDGRRAYTLVQRLAPWSPPFMVDCQPLPKARKAKR